MGEKRQLTRRDFLRLSAAAATGAVVAACAPTTPVVVEREVIKEVPVEKAVVVEKEVPREIVKEVPVEVEKQVVVEKPVEVVKEVVKEVEVERVVTSTPRPVVGPVQIEVVFVADPGLLTVWDQVFPAFEEEHPNIKVKRQLTPEDGIAERIITQVAGGAAPDVCYTHPSIVQIMAAQEVLMPLDDLADSEPEFHAEDFIPEVLRYSQWHGKTYGYPFSPDPSILYFNKTLCDKMGVEYPTVYTEGYQKEEDEWTWEKLVEWGMKLSKGEGAERTFGYWGTPSSIHWIDCVMWGYGGKPWDDDMSKCLMSEAPAVEGLKFQAEMYTKYNICPLPMQQEGVPGGFFSGKVGLMFWGRCIVPGLMEADFEVGMVPNAKGPKGRFNRDATECHGICPGTKHLEAAWEWVKWLVGPAPGKLGGMKYFFEGHRATPSRKSHFDIPTYLESMLPWEDAEMYQDAADRVLGLPMPDRYGEINRAWREQWESVLLGQKSMEEATKAACEEIDKLLVEK